MYAMTHACCERLQLNRKAFLTRILKCFGMTDCGLLQMVKIELYAFTSRILECFGMAACGLLEMVRFELKGLPTRDLTYGYLPHPMMS